MNTIDIRREYGSVVFRLRESVKARADWYVEYNEHVYSKEEIFYFEFLDKCIEDDIKQLQLAVKQNEKDNDKNIINFKSKNGDKNEK